MQWLHEVKPLRAPTLCSTSTWQSHVGPHRKRPAPPGEAVLPHTPSAHVLLARTASLDTSNSKYFQLGLKQNWQVVAALMPSPEMGKRPKHSMASWFYTGQVGPVTDANQGEKPWSLKKIKNQEGLYGFEKRN